MLPKKLKLSKKEVEKVFKEGQVISGNFLILKWKSAPLQSSLFGVIVPLSFSKKSSKRNKIKRQILAILQKIISKFKEGFKILLIVKNHKKEIPLNLLEKEIIFLLKKGKFLKNG
jgi:ribonuclease P protein component